MALWLARLGARVRGYALDPATAPNLFEAARIATCLEDVRGDINDLTALRRSLAEFEPEVVLHMAAQPLVRASYADPLGTYRTNVLGTAHLLEAVRYTASVRAVVCVTTDKVYENREWEHPYTEADPLGGYDPYSSSKACAELVTAAYRQSFFSGSACRVATARAGNVIGGGDWSSDRLIPDVIRSFSRGEPVSIRRPHSIRPWGHVLEPLHGYLLLAQAFVTGQPNVGSVYNFAPREEDAWPVSRVVERMAQLWGDGAHAVLDPDPGVHEAGLLKLSAAKAQAELGWQPVLGLEDALEWVVEWHRAYAAGEDMADASLRQLAAFDQRLQEA